MPLCEKPVYIHEPTPLQCGQAVLAMLSGKSVEEMIEIVGTERETDLRSGCIPHLISLELHTKKTAFG